MRKRLDDTAALRSMPSGPGEDYESVDTSIRRIDNGWVQRTTRSGGPDGYCTTERFSPEKPSLGDDDDLRSKDSAVGSECMRDAIESLK